MADSIVQTKRTVDGNGAIVQYDVTYKFQTETRTHSATFTVLAADMILPSDLNELKTTTDALALTEKNRKFDLVAADKRVEQFPTDLNGTVTL